MKIDVTKIEGFNEMSPEEQIKALTEFEFEDNTNQIEKLEAELNKVKGNSSKQASEISEYKKKLAAKMSESEKAETEKAELMKTMEEELKALKREKSISDYKATFIGLGYDKDLALSSAEAWTDGDAIKAFSDLHKFMEAHDKALLSKNLDNNPGLGKQGNPNQTITREEFGKMGYAEMVAFKESNPDLYEQYTK